MGRTVRLAISVGDPTGIGPEVTLKALANLPAENLTDVTVVGDRSALNAVARRHDLPVPQRIAGIAPSRAVREGFLSAAGARAAVDAVKLAVALIQRGQADALVTAPINKDAMRLAGYTWSGHTELLAHLTGTHDVRMLLVRGNLRIVHVTTHVSLSAAIRAARSQKRILKTIELADRAGSLLSLERRRIGVAGLNPHAGENGMFGDEETRYIRPALERAAANGIDAVGPIPADTLFWRAERGEFDVQVAMYHDQGHIPVKLPGIADGVNVSLGLPFIRTSVDHGTALDIAGKGIADWRSMGSAIQLAVDIVRREKLEVR